MERKIRSWKQNILLLAPHRHKAKLNSYHSAQKKWKIVSSRRRGSERAMEKGCHAMPELENLIKIEKGAQQSGFRAGTRFVA
jgi:hypothetical protein